MSKWLLANITLHSDDSPAEERANALTHLLGALLALAGMAALVLRTARAGELHDVIGAVVFGLSMVALYSASTAYHTTQHPVAKRLFRVLDHLSIYFLIAGTYTPITLALGGRLGWGLFAAIWSVSAVGVVFTFRFWGRYRLLHVAVYVLAGWLIVVAWEPLVQIMPGEMFGWILAGGLTYTLGTVAYAARRLRYHHAVWHLFVLGGSACMFIGIYRNVLAL